MKGPAVVRSSATNTKDNIFVYWCSPKGEIQPAADSRITEAQLQRMPEYRHWRRCEAVGAKEIEKISLILSRQMFEQKKQMKVEQHLREKFALDQLKVRCQLRMAQGYSKNDEEMNRRILQRAKHSEDMLYRVIASEFDPGLRNTALAIEVKEKSTSKVANIAQKREGILV